MKQVDKAGKALQTLPRPLATFGNATVPDLRFPADLPVKPYDLAHYVGPNEFTGNLVHRFYQNQYQINGGRNDRYVAWSDNGGLVMSYFDGTDLPVGRLARQYVMADNFFQAAFGGSFLNHFWLVCACTPVWPDAPIDKVATFDVGVCW